MSELFVLSTEMSDTKFVTTRARRRRLTGAGIENDIRKNATDIGRHYDPHAGICLT